MLDISKLKNRKALVKLEDYNGNNEYLISLKTRMEKEGSFFISPSVAEYIELNFDREPLEINKVIEINEFLGKQLQTKYNE